MSVIERFIRGTKETVKLGVTFDRTVPQDLINIVTAPLTGYTSINPAKLRHDIMVPRNADVSNVPASWAIHLMNTLVYDGDSLIREKKHDEKS